MKIIYRRIQVIRRALIINSSDDCWIYSGWQLAFRKNIFRPSFRPLVQNKAKWNIGIQDLFQIGLLD
jgi:hypothetical protein